MFGTMTGNIANFGYDGVDTVTRLRRARARRAGPVPVAAGQLPPRAPGHPRVPAQAGAGLAAHRAWGGGRDRGSAARQSRAPAQARRPIRGPIQFVGLSSRLASVACCPIVLISGFTHSTNELTTSYRVIKWHVCNSYWNAPRRHLDDKDFLWCPRHHNTQRHFECTRLITAAQGTRTIQHMPSFGRHATTSARDRDETQANTKA